jgi:hypothetical protein
MFLVSGLAAQDSPKAGGTYLSIDAGYSIPLDKYASTDPENSSSGFAGGGFIVQFAADWVGKRAVGLGLAYALQYNPLDKSAQDVSPSGQQFMLGSKPWINNYLLAGPSYIQTFHKITVSFAARLGVIISSTSNFYVTIPALDSSGTASTSEGVGLGLAYQLRAGVGYTLSEKISLCLHLDYLGGSPSRTKTYYYYIYEVDPVLGPIEVYQQSQVKIKKTVSTFNPSLGIIIKL